ncbi:MAG: LPS export ABC transporter periplasmic protein LptC [Candidatus Eremiobacteraeota bacterium]|nr:LPS export ABC transporter periplasmic protein LptC [Candidatus Eremiobacteraeota bacterium]
MKGGWIAFAATVALSACNPQVPKGTATPPPSPTALASPALALKISGNGTAQKPVRIVSQKGNRKQYELITRSFVSNGAQGSARATFRNVHVTFFGKDGSTLIADAPRAQLDQTANTVELLGGVTAHNGSGMMLQCDDLLYNRTTEMIHGTGHVLITDPHGLHATGHRLDSDITLTNTKMQ